MGNTSSPSKKVEFSDSVVHFSHDVITPLNTNNISTNTNDRDQYSSIPLSNGDTVCSEPHRCADIRELTEEEIVLIRETWRLVKQDMEKVGVIMFLELFESHKDFRDSFAFFRGKNPDEIQNDPRLQIHGLRVLNVVDKVVSRLNCADRVDALTKELGCKHAKYGIKPDFIPKVGEQLLTTIHPALENHNQWNPTTQRCWTHVLTYMSRQIQLAMEMQIKLDNI